MLHFFYDFFPVLLFFLAFKFYGIYVATVVGIVTTGLQVIVTYFWKKKFDKQQVLTLIVFTIFGSMTLYFHNPLFVKWKPTVMFWIFGIVVLISQFIGKKTIVERLFETALKGKANVPMPVWKRLNFAWFIFFSLLGTLNLYIAYQYSTDIWVNFKFYGIMGLMMLFMLGQVFCLARYFSE